ncbi:hypothetical protein [Geobacter sulfurreducens]|uniref:hypothetical protein n=1 Tax=Geobacter sulfurreducens TaxID=35554 RepID=UPI000DBB0F8B|nr:hypothetical protein [Geobacter sulfurreducens]BBA69298.1 hypothetical protein YM18_0750 [Geobacter sulfurreducens]
MKKFDSAFGSAATKVATAAKKTAEEYAEKKLPDEPAFTTALATRIKDSLSGFAKGGITWNAKILSSHGPNTEESKFGADILGALHLDLPGYNVNKGFLAQAKRQEPGKHLVSKEWARLQEQCNTMLNFTSESYVFIYSLNGVFVVPSISVVACNNIEDLHTLHPKNLSAFYKEHFMCFVGDRAIDSATPKALDNLIARVKIQISASTTVETPDLFTNLRNEESERR